MAKYRDHFYFTFKLILFFLFQFQRIDLAWSIEESDPFSVSLPSEYKEMVKGDQNGNILGFKSMTESEKEIIHLYHFEVNEVYLRLYLSPFIGEEEDRVVKVPQENGGFKYRVFFADDQSFAFRKMRNIFGKPKVEFYATKMQSHSTYFIWKPKTEIMAFLKLQGRDRDTTTHELTVKSAIETNTALEYLSQQTLNPSDISFFPERFGASLNLKGDLNYSYSLRGLKPTDASYFSKDVSLHSVHGFFSSSKLKEILKQKNISLEEWIERFYAPKLGHFIAVTNFRYGIYTEAHTQNLVIKINAKGEIEGFSFRDLADVAIDAMVSLRSPSLTKMLSFFEGNKMLSRLGRNHVSYTGYSGAFEYLGAGWVNGGYVGGNQFIMNSESVEQAERYFRSFFEAYLKTSSDVTGVVFDRNVLEQKPLLSHGKDYFGYEWFEYVYAKVAERFLLEVENEWARYDQTRLQRIFKRHFRETLNVAFINASALPQILWNLGALSGKLGTDVQYSIHHDKIFAFDRVSGKAIAFAFGLTPNEISEIQYELISKHKDLPPRKRDHLRRAFRRLMCRKSANL